MQGLRANGHATMQPIMWHTLGLVRRFRQLEQKVLTAVEAEVLRWEGVEGVVAWVGGGRACKVKNKVVVGSRAAAAAQVVKLGCSK